MASAAITVTFPASIANDVPVMAQRLIDRMHLLLERNANGELNFMEQDELKALVDMAEFAQVMAVAFRPAMP